MQSLLLSCIFQNLKHVHVELPVLSPIYTKFVIRFWKLIDECKQNITQEKCKYILGVLAGYLGIDNADRAGIFKNATLQEYEERDILDDRGMYI